MVGSKKIVIFGTGGFAAEVKWLIDDINKASKQSNESWNIEAFVGGDKDSKEKNFEGLPVISEGEFEKSFSSSCNYVVAIGDNAVRKKIVENFIKDRYSAAILLHPSVSIGQHVQIGLGSIVMHQSILAPYSNIGKHALINTHTTVGHHATLANFTNICPGARLSGHSTVEEGGLVGSNAVLHPSATLKSWSNLAPCSLLLKNSTEQSSWIGVPAKKFF